MFGYNRRQNYLEIDDDQSKKSKQTKNFLVIAASIAFVGLVAVTAVVTLTPTNRNNNEVVLQSPRKSSQRAKTTQVRISNGALEGVVLKSRRGRDYSAFYNIPYAQPAVGPLRFEPPVEFTEKWHGLRDATKPGAMCIQVSFHPEDPDVDGEEDCQYLTVYAPKVFGSLPHRRQRKLLPVMVYLLGGAFIKGHASIYGGDYFMDEDVIIVLPETRFGVMAFLSTGDTVVPGNMGFKDQVEVLRWVQKNIAKFGGDPKRVTIFGNSSGATSVHLHMMSNMTSGLFHRAICQSGVGIVPNTGSKVNTTKIAFDLGVKLDCPVNNSTGLVNCLKEIDAKTLLDAAGKEVEAIVVESTDVENPFLTATPFEIMMAGTQPSSNVPWILGVNSDEFNVAQATLASLNVSLLHAINSNWNALAPILLDLQPTPNLTSISESIYDFYFGSKLISNETRQNFSNLIDDRMFVHPTYMAGRLQAEFNQNNVYLYVLSKKPIVSLGSDLESLFGPPYGVTHADEVQYLFPYSKFPYIGLDSVDLEMSETMVKIWTKFAATGNPHRRWAPISNSGDATGTKWFQLDDELKMINFPADRMKFWNQFALTYLYA